MREGPGRQGSHRGDDMATGALANPGGKGILNVRAKIDVATESRINGEGPWLLQTLSGLWAALDCGEAGQGARFHQPAVASPIQRTHGRGAATDVEVALKPSGRGGPSLP